MDEPSQAELRKKENPLRIGVSTLDELEEKIKAFRIMNQSALKKRFIMSREDVRVPTNRDPLLTKGEEIDISRAKLLRRHFGGEQEFKCFQPDEGIVIVSDMNEMAGISLSMDIVTQMMNLGGGAYEGFIDRVDSFSEFLNLLKKALFPKLIIVGFLPPGRLETEQLNFVRIKRVDHYIRAIELTHSIHKPRPYFPKLKQVHIESGDQRSWARFIVEVVREYTKSYFVEDF
ncbi:MAG: hypothetical protein CMN76_14000 [Spirochaetaceae bacterium]|nr:hypothetical protein [Spirochaetaceae bacterium]|tara:strand:- start:228382 stop:229074 length:693 start_codon:yes stop_codon:yes gene_type:complete